MKKKERKKKVTREQLNEGNKVIKAYIGTTTTTTTTTKEKAPTWHQWLHHSQAAL